MSNVILEVKNLYKTWGNLKALDNVSLTLNEGDFTAVMGDSGCGKSTLLYLMGGLEKPDQGTILFLGEDLSKLSDKRLGEIRSSQLGFVFQFYNLVMNLTVEENILLPLVMAKKKIKDYQKDLDDLLKMLGIEEIRKKTPEKLSGGEQQRVAIARAVISKPKLILADEPTGNLDSKSGNDVLNIFKEINEKFGITIFMVTHSKKASSFAKNVLTMSDGVLK